MNLITTPSARLDGLRAARAVAAIGVVLFHVNNYFLPVLLTPGEDAGNFWRIGQHGVELFFVLSGFLMMLPRARGIGRPARAGTFLARRFARIFPFYWAVLAAILLGLALEPRFGEARIGVASLAQSVLLLPGPGDPVMRVAWTLQHEVMFYLAFALMITRPVWGGRLFGLWMAACAIAPFVTDLHAPLDRILSPFNLCFGMGMIAAIVWPRVRFRTPGLVAIGAAIFLAGALGEMHGQPWGEAARVAIFGLGSAFLVLGLAAPMRVARPLGFLGDASYAIYLTHGAALTLIGHAVTVPAWVPAWTVLPLAAGFAVAAGVGAHLAIERPLRALMRSDAATRVGPILRVAPLQAGRRRS